MTIKKPTDAHLSAEDVAAYLSREVTEEDRQRIESHLVTCAACCDEIVALGHNLPESRARWPMASRVGLAAAAVLAGVLLLGPGFGLFPSDEEPAFRGSQASLETSLRPSIEALAPGSGSAVGRDSVLFVWRPAAADAFYSLTLTDREGGLIWRGNTRDTLLALNPDVRLSVGDQYYWYVDALLDSGESPTTGVHRFTAR
jgi:hypothetical protein